MIKVGIDIGGTFTDAIALDDITGEYWSAKSPTTYPDPSEGFMHNLRKLLDIRHLNLANVDLIIHGTTLVTNAIIERKGGPVGLLATAGFGDTLWMRTERRYDLFDVMIDFPEPLVSRPNVVEIPERIRYNGAVETALDEEAVLQGLEKLVAAGVGTIAVCFLHSYANPTHETRVAELVRQHYPELKLSLSSEVWPESGEYYRMSTTVANAYVQLVMEAYFNKLVSALTENGYRGKLYLMLSNGGIAAVETGRRYPVQLIESGPAAGVLAATFLAQEAGVENVLSFDMGGTTAKLSLIENGLPLPTDLIEAARIKRHMPGSGIPIKVPVIDLLEIGSGGGSIARIDHMGLLKTGPESAGSDPGPACYGWGGKTPTVTDADLVLGYLNPDYFLGGEMSLDCAAAEEAIARYVADKSILSVTEAAWGIHEVVNQNMALAAKMHVLERGHDPARYALVAYGGAGPLHAYGIARQLGIGSIIIPPGAGVAASLGFLTAPIAFDLLQSFRMPLPSCDWETLTMVFDELSGRGATVLAEADVDREDMNFSWTADMRYIGQGFEVPVSIANGPLNASCKDEITASFESAYRERYTHLPNQGDQIEFVRLRVRAWTAVSPPVLPRVSSEGVPAPYAQRPVFFGEAGRYDDTPVYRWETMIPGNTLSGPAIIESADTTVVVGPESHFSMSEIGYLTIHLDQEHRQ